MNEEKKINKAILLSMTALCMLISFFVAESIWRSNFGTQQVFYSATFYFILQCIAMLLYFVNLNRKYKNIKVLHIVYMGMMFSLIILVPAFFLKVSKGMFQFKKYVDYLYFPAYTMFTGLTFIGAIFPFLQKKDSLKEISLINKLSINGIIFIVLIIVFAIEKFFNIKF